MESIPNQLECHFRNMLIDAKQKYMNALRVLLAEFNADKGPNYGLFKFGAIEEFNQLLWRYILEKGNMRTLNALRSLQFMRPDDDVEMKVAIYNLRDDLEMLYLTEQQMYLCSQIERSIWTDFIGSINEANDEDFVQSYIQQHGRGDGANLAEEPKMPLSQALADLDLDSSERDETEHNMDALEAMPDLDSD